MGSRLKRLRKALEGRKLVALDFETHPLKPGELASFFGGDPMHSKPELLFFDETDRVRSLVQTLRPDQIMATMAAYHARKRVSDRDWLTQLAQLISTKRGDPARPRTITLSGLERRQFWPHEEVTLADTDGNTIKGTVEPGEKPGEFVLTVDPECL